jgi:hypothetical protein
MPLRADPLAEAIRTILCVVRSSSIAVARTVPSVTQKSPYTIRLAPAASASLLSAEIPGEPARLPSKPSKECKVRHWTA